MPWVCEMQIWRRKYCWDKMVMGWGKATFCDVKLVFNTLNKKNMSEKLQLKIAEEKRTPQEIHLHQCLTTVAATVGVLC